MFLFFTPVASISVIRVMLSGYRCGALSTTPIKGDRASLNDTTGDLFLSPLNQNGLNNRVLDLEARIIFNLKLSIP